MPVLPPHIPGWYVMSAFRREKQAEDSLVAHGFEVFLPKVTRTVKEPHRRPRQVEIPAVATFIFVRAAAGSLTDYKQRVDPRLKFYTVPVAGALRRQPLVVPDSEMNAFIRLWEERTDVRAEISPWSGIPAAGTRVRVTAGPLQGLEGICTGRQGRTAVRLSVSLHGLMTVTATLPLSFIAPV